ncbi:hypothetical protein Dda_8984 [Drechslerella dactyloides]|uniref:GST C-terminal domain-containing protein n=1 Tax=Drechslerella dactyloides TaxID=74499 RepID=A0AAD6NFG5_DREDA|nr:hypothetical protein Dda_8984 [Drechslerella dactyloides]
MFRFFPRVIVASSAEIAPIEQTQQSGPAYKYSNPTERELTKLSIRGNRFPFVLSTTQKMAQPTAHNGKDSEATIYKMADKDGQFRRKPSSFRSLVSPDPSAKFAAEKDRYVLYVNWGCPWAHRTNIVRSLKGLEDIIQLVVMDFTLTPEGWLFNGNHGTMEKDPLYGFTKLSELYYKADPNYEGRYTVPVLWDKKTQTIVNNESSEIIRMFYTAFDHLLPESLREASHPAGGYLPHHLRQEIEEMNDWVYDKINNGVYKTGFATTQEAYLSNVIPLFESLDRLENHLEEKKTKYLFGSHITEADIRLYTTLIRFDVAYYTIFKCNYKMIRYDYPRLHRWLRVLYWEDNGDTRDAFRKTTYFETYKEGYSRSLQMPIVPYGPKYDIMPLED